MFNDNNQENQIRNRISAFEKDRQSASRKTFFAGLILIPLGLIFGYIAGLTFGHPVPGIFVAAAFLVVFAILQKAFYQNIKEDFKFEVIRPIIKKFSPHLNYAPAGFISADVFKRSKLFNSRYNRFTGEDLIHGKIGDTQFQLSEISAIYRDSDDGDTTVFKGLFIHADFHKYFHSRTYIKPDTVLRGIGLNKKKWADAHLTHMEDPVFEDAFRVFSTDDQDARYILSPTMMQRITDLRAKFGCDIHISFQGTKMFVAIETGNMNFFDSHLKNQMDKDRTFDMISQEVEFLLSTIDDLNLNTRIWSKQPGMPEAEPLDREEDDLYFS